MDLSELGYEIKKLRQKKTMVTRYIGTVFRYYKTDYQQN